MTNLLAGESSIHRRSARFRISMNASGGVVRSALSKAQIVPYQPMSLPETRAGSVLLPRLRRCGCVITGAS